MYKENKYRLRNAVGIVISETTVKTAAVITATVTLAAALPTAITAVAVIATVAGQIVEKSCYYRRGRGLPYNGGYGIAESYNRRLARIIGYIR